MERKKHKIKRFIKNQYNINSIDIKSSIKQILEQIEISEKSAQINFPPEMSKSIDSLGNKKTKPTFYVGTAGNIYIYWKQYLFHDKNKEYLEKFHESLKTNLSIIEEKDSDDINNSFFMGYSGIYLFYCIYECEIKHKENFEKYFNILIDLKKCSERKYAEVELLYGATGYLYSLLFLKKYLSSKDNNNNVAEYKKYIPILDSSIIDIFNLLLNKGIHFMNEYEWNKSLLFPFSLKPTKTPKFYLGAAHGLIGALYMLLSTIKFFPELLKKELILDDKKSTIKKLIFDNLKYIQSLQIKETGNFPSDVQGHDSGEKVHFCHGCIGSIYLFLLAEEFFPNNGFKETSFLCNKCLWERGLLYKGNGLCHGMSGIVYALIKLYKYSKNELYLKEAVGICYGTFDYDIQELVKNFVDPQRKCKGIPDTPYSLMEGEGGCLVMYYDLASILLKKDNSDFTGFFPGYEIF